MSYKTFNFPYKFTIIELFDSGKNPKLNALILLEGKLCFSLSSFLFIISSIIKLIKISFIGVSLNLFNDFIIFSSIIFF